MRLGVALMILGGYAFAILFGMGWGLMHVGAEVIVERWHAGLWATGAIALAGLAEVLR